VRVGDDLTDDVSVVVRGGDLDAEVLRQDALGKHAVYGTYAISVFAARSHPRRAAQLPPLVRFERLTLMTVAALRAAGLRLDPTGRNPRHFDLPFDELASVWHG